MSHYFYENNNYRAVEHKIVLISNFTHSTALRLWQRTHFNPPITSKVIHIQSLRD